MLEKTKKLSRKINILPSRSAPAITTEDVKLAREYVAGYWPKLTRYHPEDDESLIGLPHSYLVPSYAEGQEFDYNELYYWDSYFMVQGMFDSEHKALVTGILEDLLYELKRFKIIPNGSRLYYTSRSQPPLLSTFILEVYETYKPSKQWLKKSIQLAQSEYHNVWMGTRKPNARQVHRGLSRYYDFNYLHDIAEAESGWDMTPRFYRKALNYLPVDLNALLYKYEKDFAQAAEILGHKAEAKTWEHAARQRRIAVDELMWSKARGIYYDYNYVKGHRGSVNSLAAYYPMWAGMASKRQAARLVSGLRRFENKGGLATTDTPTFSLRVPSSLPTQWAHPNGWAPLHFIVVKGLQRYGYHDDARRIALKWVKTNLDWFNKNGVFLEKYNVVQPEKPPVKGVYPAQTGFGWTNAVFERFCAEFIDPA